MIGVLEITLIVPTLRVGMPLRTLRVRSRMWRRCAPKLQRYPRHAPGSLNPQSVPFVTRSVTGGIPTQSVGTITTISVEADLCITMSALRGHAARDAPRPICLVAQMFQCPAQSCGPKKCQAHGLALIPATATVRTAASCLAAVACRRSLRRSFPGWPVRSCARRR